MAEDASTKNMKILCTGREKGVVLFQKLGDCLARASARKAGAVFADESNPKYNPRGESAEAQDAKRDQAQLSMGTIQEALQMYRIHTNKYPTGADGLKALLENTENAPKWRGPYIEAKKLLDPWDRLFFYISDGRTFRIISSGPDGKLDSPDDVTFP